MAALRQAYARSGRERKPAVVDALLSCDTPLDEDEQDTVLQELGEQQLAQSRVYRLVFGIGSVVLAAFFLVSAHAQHTSPWQARFTGELRTVTQAGSVTAVLLLQGLALVAAAAGLLLGLPRKGDIERGCMPASLQAMLLLSAAVAGTGISATYWTAALRQSWVVYGSIDGARWDLLWLPLLPLGYALVCLYVQHSVASTGRELRQLQKLKYDHKKV